MTCKDCIHYDICLFHEDTGAVNLALNADKECRYFKDKSNIIELPCKVGDRVYSPKIDPRFPVFIESITITKDDVVYEWYQLDEGYELTEIWDAGDFSIKDYGKTWFLSEEAEKRLEELSNGAKRNN